MSSMALPSVGSISGSSPRPADSCSMAQPLSPDASWLGSPFFQVSVPAETPVFLRLSPAAPTERSAFPVELRDARHRQQDDGRGHGGPRAEPFRQERRE